MKKSEYRNKHRCLSTEINTDVIHLPMESYIRIKVGDTHNYVR